MHCQVDKEKRQAWLARNIEWDALLGATLPCFYIAHDLNRRADSLSNGRLTPGIGHGECVELRIIVAHTQTGFSMDGLRVHLIFAASADDTSIGSSLSSTASSDLECEITAPRLA